MPYRSSLEFYRKVLSPIAAGESVVSIATDMEDRDRTTDTGREQGLIDTGWEPSLTTSRGR